MGSRGGGYVGDLDDAAFKNSNCLCSFVLLVV